MRQAHAAPFEHVPLAGDEIVDGAHGARLAVRADRDIAEVEPERARAVAVSAIATATALSRVDQFLDEADDLVVVDLREAQVARSAAARRSRAGCG